MFEDGGIYIRPTLLKREINGIDWSIYPIINYGQDYHERDFDISLIEDNVDTENYRFVHYCTYNLYTTVHIKCMNIEKGRLILLRKEK